MNILTLSKKVGGVHFLALAAALLAQTAAIGQESNADIAKKLNNPIASLISVPFQLNWDQNIGPEDDGERLVLNIQPVIPISLNEEWNLISRTILPIVSLDDIPSGNDESGLGDIVQSVFFSPVAPTDSGWVWGAGPVFLLPTASDDLLGGEKWGAGPSVVALKQANGWTYGALANHLWSFAGDSDRNDVNATFIQPFLSFTTSKLTTYTLSTESTYDWESKDWSVPVILSATQLFRVGTQIQQLSLGARYWADAPNGAAEGWGARLTYTLVFPK